MTENIDWIVEFERLARPRLQKIFEKDLVKLPMALSERLEQLRKKEASTREGYEKETTMKKTRVSSRPPIEHFNSRILKRLGFEDSPSLSERHHD